MIKNKQQFSIIKRKNGWFLSLLIVNCLLIIGFPAFSHAAPKTFAELVGLLTGFVDRGVIPVLIAVAFIVFIYGVLKYYILAGDSYTKMENARNVLLYGLIGLVVMISFWGLVKLVKVTFFG